MSDKCLICTRPIRAVYLTKLSTVTTIPMGEAIGTLIPLESIFVFGSNLAGRHGLGAALHAREHHGAVLGQGEGLQGHSYGIPTKDSMIQTLPLHQIRAYVKTFLDFASSRPKLDFVVTRIGCGYAGYSDRDIGPLFIGAPPNCRLPPDWGI